MIRIVKRRYFRVPARRGELDVVLPQGCDMEVIAYSPDQEEALIIVSACDDLQYLRDRLLAHLPTQARPTVAGGQLIAEMIHQGTRLSPLTVSKQLCLSWTGSTFDETTVGARYQDGAETFVYEDG